MDSPPVLPLVVALPRPARASSTRVHLGASELVLEATRGGHSLMWSDGREARRFSLGLANDGELALELRAPKWPLRVVVREVLALAPRGRIRGYVQVPLVPTVTWNAAGETRVLIELPPRDLGVEWDEHEGSLCRCTSPWHARVPMRSGEPRAVVPLHVRNATAEVACPSHVPLRVVDEELVELRGSIVGRPRRLVWTQGGFEDLPARTGAEIAQ
ncbi:MAG TPA: hypothetical protein VFZ65_04190 [Planctomycetota bacterium]|nr:hypothetical protein [Planctomycetota bacterium]